ncbi:hypothetical protein N7507_001735 [Penicillium longicatenatum]|nr:hypothetical protein N7507_001735 [Penicillium longicatenatum]
MSTDDRTCYYPEGNIASGTYPCTSDDITHCCGSGGICLTNGFCLDVSQPYVLSRGGCTSKTWGDGCPTQCQDVTKSEGASIINLSLINGTSLYCCGTPIYNGSEIVCPYGDSFRLDDADIILERAALVNVTDITSDSTNSTTTVTANSTTSSPSSSAVASSSSHDVAIGAGVGVPLGIIAIGTLVWALWERRRANKLSRSLGSMAAGQGVIQVGLLRL